MADPISWAVIAYTSVKGAFVMAASSAAFAMGASAATSLTVGAAAASAFKFAGITALSIAANALFAPSVGASGSPTEWRADANAGLPFVAGRLGVAGNLIYSKEFGADNRFLGNVTIYSRAGPVHSMGPFYADGVNITFGSGGAATNGGNIANNMWLSSQDGLQPQPTALPLPGALSSQTFTGWTANHKLSGCAADLQVLRQDSKFQTYPSGQPRRYRVIEGIKVYDPRLDSTFPGGDGACRLDDRSTYVYTTNAIIHALNWAIGYYENGKPVGGLADPAGPTLDGIDVEAFIAAANIADANGWTGLGARYSTADDKHQVLLGFLQAGGALYAENAGRISCVSRGAVKTSVMTLTRADTAGPVTIDAMPPRRVVINSIIPRCVQESYQWEPVDLEPVTVAAFVTADGGVRRRNKDFPFVTSSVQASQLAALDILDAREPLSGSTTFKPYVRDLKPGDAFTWSEPGFLLNGVKCVVMERSYDPASDTVEITWRSETDSKIAFALGLDPTPPVFPSVTPANPSFVPVPSTDDWGVNGGSIGDDGGPRGPVITIEADPADLTDVTHILVDVRESGEAEWTHHGEFPLAGFRRENIFGLLPDTTYDVRLRYRNAFGVVDDAQATVFLNITTGPQVVPDAIAPTADLAAAAAIISAARSRLQDAQADLKAQIEALAGSGVQADLRGAFDRWQEHLDADVQAVLDAAEAGDAAVNARVRRIEAPSENLIADAWNKAGGSENWRDQDNAPAQIVPKGDHAALRAYTSATAAGAGPTLRSMPRKRVEVGEVYEISASVTLTGVATNPRLRLQIFTAEDGAGVAGNVTQAVTAGSRDGTFTATIGAAGWARFEVLTDASGAGDASVEIAGPLWRLSSPGQAALSPAPSKDDASLAFIRSIQAVTSRLAVSEQRLRVANGHALAEIRDIVVAQLGDQSALVSQVETLEATVGGLTSTITTLQTAVAGLVEESAVIERLQVGTVLNRIRDPLLDRAGEDWRTEGVPPILLTESGARILRLERTATEAGDLGFAEHIPAIRVFEGQRLEWSPRIRLGGVASGAKLQCRFTDLNGGNESTLTGATATGSGFVAPPAFVIAPADGYVYPRIVPVASGAGALTVDFNEPQLIGALADQTTRSSFERARSPVAAELLTGRIASAREVARQERLSLAAGYVSGEVRNEAFLRQTQDGILAGQISSLSVQLGELDDNVFSKAEANQRFLLLASEGGTLAAYDLTLNSAFATTQSLAAGAQPVSTLGTAVGNLGFTTTSDVNAAIGAFDLSVNTSFQTTTNTANTALNTANAAQPVATLASAVAGLGFTTTSDVNAAIGAFDLSVNTSFQGVRDTANAALPASDLATAGATAGFLTQSTLESAVAQIDLTANTAFNNTQVAANLFLTSFTDGAGNAFVAAGFNLDANGRITGFTLSDDGVSRDADFAVDQLKVDGEVLFDAAAGGILTSNTIRTRRLEASHDGLTVILAPNIGTDELILWAGDATDASAPTRANAALAIGQSTIYLDGSRTSRPSKVASPSAVVDVASSGNWIALAQIDLDELDEINSIRISGTRIQFETPPATGPSGFTGIFDMLVAVTGTQRNPGDTVTLTTSGVGPDYAVLQENAVLSVQQSGSVVSINTNSIDAQLARRAGFDMKKRYLTLALRGQVAGNATAKVSTTTRLMATIELNQPAPIT